MRRNAEMDRIRRARLDQESFRSANTLRFAPPSEAPIAGLDLRSFEADANSDLKHHLVRSRHPVHGDYASLYLENKQRSFRHDLELQQDPMDARVYANVPAYRANNYTNYLRQDSSLLDPESCLHGTPFMRHSCTSYRNDPLGPSRTSYDLAYDPFADTFTSRGPIYPVEGHYHSLPTDLNGFPYQAHDTDLKMRIINNPQKSSASHRHSIYRQQGHSRETAIDIDSSDRHLDRVSGPRRHKRQRSHDPKTPGPEIAGHPSKGRHVQVSILNGPDSHIDLHANSKPSDTRNHDSDFFSESSITPAPSPQFSRFSTGQTGQISSKDQCRTTGPSHKRRRLGDHAMFSIDLTDIDGDSHELDGHLGKEDAKVNFKNITSNTPPTTKTTPQRHHRKELLEKKSTVTGPLNHENSAVNVVSFKKVRPCDSSKSRALRSPSPRLIRFETLTDDHKRLADDSESLENFLQYNDMSVVSNKSLQDRSDRCINEQAKAPSGLSDRKHAHSPHRVSSIDSITSLEQKQLQQTEDLNGWIDRVVSTVDRRGKEYADHDNDRFEILRSKLRGNVARVSSKAKGKPRRSNSILQSALAGVRATSGKNCGTDGIGDVFGLEKRTHDDIARVKSPSQSLFIEADCHISDRSQGTLGYGDRLEKICPSKAAEDARESAVNMKNLSRRTSSNVAQRSPSPNDQAQSPDSGAGQIEHEQSPSNINKHADMPRNVKGSGNIVRPVSKPFQTENLDVPAVRKRGRPRKAKVLSTLDKLKKQSQKRQQKFATAPLLPFDHVTTPDKVSESERNVLCEDQRSQEQSMGDTLSNETHPQSTQVKPLDQVSIIHVDSLPHSSLKEQRHTCVGAEGSQATLAKEQEEIDFFTPSPFPELDDHHYEAFTRQDPAAKSLLELAQKKKDRHAAIDPDLIRAEDEVLWLIKRHTDWAFPRIQPFYNRLTGRKAATDTLQKRYLQLERTMQKYNPGFFTNDTVENNNTSNGTCTQTTLHEAIQRMSEAPSSLGNHSTPDPHPTTSGKTLSWSTWNHYMTEHVAAISRASTPPTGTTSYSSVSPPPSRSPSPITEADKCHFTYQVRGRIWPIPDSDEPHNFNVGAPALTRAAASKILYKGINVDRPPFFAGRMCSGTTELDEEDYLTHHATTRDGINIMLWVEQDQTSFHDGVLPDSIAGFVSRRLWQIMITTYQLTSTSEDDLFGDAEDFTLVSSTPANDGEVYSTSEQANRAAGSVLLEERRKVLGRRTRLDEVQEENARVEEQVNAVVESGELLCEGFDVGDGRRIEVSVVQRTLKGARNL